MGKANIKADVCRPFCLFFTEGRKEDLICRGAEVIESFLRRDRLCSDMLPASGKSPELWRKHGGLLSRFVCLSCAFRIEDCDFTSENPPPDCEPCGGYVLLSLLLENGFLSVTDFEE